jgi:Mg2+ and Co2+ transporter CorA
MIDIYALRGSKVMKYDDKALTRIPKQKKLSWTRAVNPSEEEFETLAKLLDLDDDDKEELQDFLTEGDRPRLNKEEFVEIIYSAPVAEDNEIKTEPLAFYIKNNLLITFERKRLPVCENIAFKAMKNKNVYMFKKQKLNLLQKFLIKSMIVS